LNQTAVGLLYAFGQGALCLLLFTQPGLAALRILSRRRLPDWPPASLAASAFLLSSIILGAYQYLCIQLLPAGTIRIAAWAATTAVSGYFFYSEGKTMLQQVRRLILQRPYPVTAIILFGVFSLTVISLGPLPVYSPELGDTPFYYASAATLYSGKGWGGSYFNLDLLGGTLAYLQSHPLPVLITSLLFEIFSPNSYALNTYGSISACFVLWTVSGFVVEHARKGQSADVLTTAALLILGAIPTVFVYFTYGGHTIPPALAFLILVTLGGKPRSSAKLWAQIAAVVFMVFWRPDSALLAACYLGVNAFVALIKAPFLNLRSRAVLLLCCSSFAVWGGWQILAIAPTSLPTAFNSIGISYLKYSSTSSSFLPIYGDSW
jgi:hypothetical protein